MTKKIRKAIIPAAGLGTRMLPATKAVPKEMLPIVDKPIIQYVVEECVASGIEEIIIVINPDKTAIVNHFSKSPALEKHLEYFKKDTQLEMIKKISKMAKFRFVNQVGPYGNGTPIICSEKYIGNEPFVMIWGDEFIHANPPRLKQTIDVFNKYQKSVISAIKIPNKKDLAKYGIARTKHMEDNVYQILEIVEKPDPDKAPSNLATHGAYIFTPTIFKHLKSIILEKGKELFIADGINRLMQEEPIYACEVKDAKYYDTGNKLSYLKTNIEFALKDPQIGKEMKEYLKNMN